MKILFAIAALAVSTGLFAIATPVNAAPITRQTVVEYSDLNLANEAGAQALIDRVERAASHVCGGTPEAGNFGAWNAYRDCTKGAMDSAVSDIDQPMVDKLYGRQARVAAN